MKQIQPFQKHWLQLTSIVVCRLKGARFCENVLFLSQKASKNGRLREPAFVKMTHSPHKEPVTRKMIPLDDVIMVLPCVAICQDKSIYVKLLKWLRIPYLLW